jgi:MipA family protein
MLLRQAGFCLGLALIAVPLQAQTAGPETTREDRNSLMLGIGGGIGPEYEGSSDSGFQPGGILQGKVDGFAFQVRGPNIYIDLIRDAPDSRARFKGQPDPGACGSTAKQSN